MIATKTNADGSFSIVHHENGAVLSVQPSGEVRLYSASGLPSAGELGLLSGAAASAAIAEADLGVVTGVDGTGSNAASKADVDTALSAIETTLNDILAALRAFKVIAAS